MIKILVVEDDINLNAVVVKYLENNGYNVKGCINALDAYLALGVSGFDLIISDIMMPNIDGFEFAKTVREKNKTIPILFTTARDDISAKQKGFAIGIDDYLVKPFDLEELVLRVGALLRRANIVNTKKLVVGTLIMNEDEQTVSVNNKEISLTTREFNILYKMLSYPNKAWTRNQLVDEFWGSDCESTSRTVDVFITKLREKFATCKDFEIITIRGFGYKVVLNEKK
jgi:DNA-binding response OmpR family regulator